MDEVAAAVLAETNRFYEALPVLLDDFAGKWVIFREGAVVGDFADEEDAYLTGLKEFGAQGGHAIMHVIEGADAPLPLTAGVVFGLG